MVAINAGKGVRAPLGKAKEGEDLQGFKDSAGTSKLLPKTIELGMRRLSRRSTGLEGIFWLRVSPPVSEVTAGKSLQSPSAPSECCFWDYFCLTPKAIASEAAT